VRHDLATTEALLAQIDDQLTEGYVWALTGDGWSMRIEQCLHQLGSDMLVAAVDDRDLRALAREHARFRRDLIALRRELAALRRERDRLRAHWRASSG
jgi:ABC-type phosphate transport system auxiliary subunit